MGLPGGDNISTVRLHWRLARSSTAKETLPGCDTFLPSRPGGMPRRRAGQKGVTSGRGNRAREMLVRCCPLCSVRPWALQCLLLCGSAARIYCTPARGRQVHSTLSALLEVRTLVTDLTNPVQKKKKHQKISLQPGTISWSL